MSRCGRCKTQLLVVREYRSGSALCMCGCGGPATVPQKTNSAYGEVKGRPRPYLRGHAPRKSRPAGERFWEKVDKSGECWEWTAHIGPTGYGTFRDGGRSWRAHRWSYESAVGVIPEGLELDHLCRNRRCVNPAHLEAVTSRENILRGESGAAQNAAKTHCLHGHALTPENVHVNRKGHRICIACRRVQRRKSYYRGKAEGKRQ